MAAELDVFAVTEADIPEVSQFLRGIFNLDEHWAPFRPDVLRWKALDPHSLWQGSRGYIVRSGNKIVAHGCAMPSRFLFSGGQSNMAAIVDWTADKAYPGTGVIIFRHIGDFTDGLIAVGGSEDSQKVLPRLGFERRQDFLNYTRVEKPFGAWMGGKDLTVRGMARFGRDVVRLLKPVSGNAKGWSARKVPHFDESIAPVLPKPDDSIGIVCYRDAGLLNYFLRCPAARMEGYLLLKAGTLKGYCVLAYMGDECRIADLWISCAHQDDWTAAYLVVGQIAAASGAAKVVSGFSARMLPPAIGNAGEFLSGRQPLFVKDPEQRLPAGLDLALGMLDTDAFYL